MPPSKSINNNNKRNKNKQFSSNRQVNVCIKSNNKFKNVIKSLTIESFRKLRKKVKFERKKKKKNLHNSLKAFNLY